MATFSSPLPDDVQSVQTAGHLAHHQRLRGNIVELRQIIAALSSADITDASQLGRDLMRAGDQEAARAILGAGTGSGSGGSPTVETIPGGSVLFVRKNGSTWPTRPTARTDVMVLWVGAEPSPAIVTSGTGGMLDGVDGRMVTP